MDMIASSIPALVLVGAVLIPAAIFVYLWLSERALGALGQRWTRRLRPLVWLLVPIILIATVLAYPLVITLTAAFQSKDGSSFVGFDNFTWALSGDMLSTIGNNIVWLVVFPLATVVLAMVSATLFDKVRYERLAMTLIVLPTAISFTAGSVIWRQMYSYRAAGTPQTGLINGIVSLFGLDPQAWLQMRGVNTLLLIGVAVWGSIGVAALIISAALKNVPAELLEAVRLDGAGELRTFFTIVVPEIFPTLLVVATTQVIFALKVFDIVYVMTNGNYGTNVLGNRMYFEYFAAGNLGHASVIAAILLVVSIPIVAVNIRQFRAEELAK